MAKGEQERPKRIPSWGPGNSLKNLGYSLGAKEVRYIDAGSFGNVVANPEKKLALKVIKHLLPMAQLAATQAVLNEFTVMLLSDLVSEIRRSGRSAQHALPYGPPPPPPDLNPELQGNTCFVLPSIENPGFRYPVIAMRLAPMARGTLECEARMVSMLCFSEGHEVQHDGFVRCASLMEGAVMAVNNVHECRIAHRDVKFGNLLMYHPKAFPITGYHQHHLMSGEIIITTLGDLGKALTLGIGMETADVQLMEYERAAIQESRKHPPRPVGEEYGLHLVPKLSLELVTGCFPDSRRDLKTTIRTEIPRQRQKGWDTMAYSPVETQPSLYPDQERLEARNWQPGDVWSLGVMMAEVMMGRGKRHCLSTDFSRSNQTDSKKLFAEWTDQVMWSKYLEKSTAWRHSEENPGEVPDEWVDAIDLLRGLTRLDPRQRLTARDALQHPFLKLADKIHEVPHLNHCLKLKALL
jgi:hypothetical protein